MANITVDEYLAAKRLESEKVGLSYSEDTQRRVYVRDAGKATSEAEKIHAKFGPDSPFQAYMEAKELEFKSLGRKGLNDEQRKGWARTYNNMLSLGDAQKEAGNIQAMYGDGSPFREYMAAKEHEARKKNLTVNDDAKIGWAVGYNRQFANHGVTRGIAWAQKQIDDIYTLHPREQQGQPAVGTGQWTGGARTPPSGSVNVTPRPRGSSEIS